MVYCMQFSHFFCASTPRRNKEKSTSCDHIIRKPLFPPRLRQVKERGVSSLAALSELDVNQQLSSPIPPPYGCVRPSAGGCRIAKRPTESARRSICCHRPASFRRK